MEWFTKLFGWLFQRGGGYRADFAAVTNRWQGIYDKVVSRLDAVETELVTVRHEYQQCQEERLRDRATIRELRQVVKLLEKKVEDLESRESKEGRN